VNIYVSAADVFGLEWMNVHLQDCGDKKVVTGDVTSINSAHFEFTLSVEKAVSSLFNSFAVNITASDQNQNVGYRNEEVASITEIVTSNIIGKLIEVVSVNNIIINKFINFIIYELLPRYNIELFMDINYSDMGIFNIHNNSDSVQAIGYIVKYFNNLFEPVITYIKSDIERIYNIIINNIILPDIFSRYCISISLDTIIDEIYNKLDLFIDICEFIYHNYDIPLFNMLLHLLLEIRTQIIDLSFLYNLNDILINNIDMLDINNLIEYVKESTKSLTINLDQIWMISSTISMLADFIIGGVCILLAFTEVGLPLIIIGIAFWLTFLLEEILFDFYWVQYPFEEYGSIKSNERNTVSFLFSALLPLYNLQIAIDLNLLIQIAEVYIPLGGILMLLDTFNTALSVAWWLGLNPTEYSWSFG